MTDIRGIPSKKEAEAYLNSIALTYLHKKLIFGRLLCFGLRLQELWHIKLEDNKVQIWRYTQENGEINQRLSFGHGIFMLIR